MAKLIGYNLGFSESQFKCTVSVTPQVHINPQQGAVKWWEFFVA